MADTLRSIAVLVAATIAYSVEDVSPAMADASAAVIVSVIIAVSLGPLIIGLIQTWSELQALKKERHRIPWMEPSMEQYQHLPSMSPR